MSDALDPADERDLLAAEFALSLLEGEALGEARRLFREDPLFSRLVEQWEVRFSPLFAAVPEVTPPARVWARVERVLDREKKLAEAIRQLRTRARLWRGYGLVTTALAAGLALMLVLRVADPGAPPAQPTSSSPEPVLLAALAAENGNASLAVVFERRQGTMLVTPARLRTPTGRDLQLWLIPAGATRPVSLGVIRATTPQRLSVAASVAASLGPNATVALSIEPIGGSPTGLPTGQVIATGLLARI